MKMAEILRKLAEIVDSADLTTNSTMARATIVDIEPPEESEDPVMIPPLQSKLELLKKSVGVANAYDEPCGCDDDDEELSILVRNAGIAAQIEASEDNDITG